MQVACASVAECRTAGLKLFNTTAQTAITDNLARNGLSVLPSTFQVFGVNNLQRRGNDTLAPARLAPPPAPLLPALLPPGGLNLSEPGLFPGFPSLNAPPTATTAGSFADVLDNMTTPRVIPGTVGTPTVEPVSIPPSNVSSKGIPATGGAASAAAGAATLLACAAAALLLL